METAKMPILSRVISRFAVLIALCGVMAAINPARGFAAGTDKLAAGTDTMTPNAVVNPDKPLDTLTFTQVNKSGDGHITVDEFKQSGLSDSLFSAIDANHDGVVTREEFDSYGPVMRAKN